jgi:hypothetical protein
MTEVVFVVAGPAVTGLGLVRGQGENTLPPLFDDFIGAKPVGEEGMRAGVRAMVIELADVAKC